MKFALSDVKRVDWKGNTNDKTTASSGEEDDNDYQYLQ